MVDTLACRILSSQRANNDSFSLRKQESDIYTASAMKKNFSRREFMGNSMYDAIEV